MYQHLTTLTLVRSISMTIYADAISVAMGISPITEHFPDYNFDFTPHDSINMWGGDTTSRTYWVTNGPEEVLLHHSEEVPTGWKRGRKSSLPFKNSEKQKEFSSMAKSENRSAGSKKAWADGKMAKRDTTNLGMNQNWTPERKAKHREIALNHKKLTCPHCSVKASPSMSKRWHFDNCKSLKATSHK